MFNLIILFTGLCVYVPEVPLSMGTANQLRVLMPIAPAHEAVLLIRAENVTSFPAFCTRKTVSSFDYYQCDLRRRLVTVSPSRQDRVQFARTRTGSPICPDSTDGRDFSWVADMNMLQASNVTACVSCVYFPESEPSRLNAQVLLTEGVVEVGSFARLGRDDGDIAIWESQPGGLRQALADVIRFSRQGIAGPSIRFEFLDLGSNTWSELIASSVGNADVVVEMKNVSVNDICPKSATRNLTLGHEELHFQHIYQLLEGVGHPRPTVRTAVTSCPPDNPPEEIGFCLRDATTPTLGNPQCPGAAMDQP